MPISKYQKYQISWPMVWLGLIASNAVFAIIMLWSLPHLSQIANGLVMFDARPTGYTLLQAQAVIDALDKTGIEFYLNTQLWLDSFYPALFAIGFALLIAKFLQAYKLSNWLKLSLLIAPVLTALFDYGENHYITLMLQSDLPLTAQLAAIANLTTLLKAAASTVTQVTSLILFVLFLIQKFRK